MRIPPAAKKAIKRHVEKAVLGLDPARFHQEPAYVAALFGRLDGDVYNGNEMDIKFRSTIINDRGSGSAESVWGADFGITAVINVFDRSIRKKGALGQAKRGSLLTQGVRDRETFRQQVLKMDRATWAICGLEVPVTPGLIPIIRVIEVADLLAKDIVIHRHYNELQYEPALFAPDGGLPILMSKPIFLDRYLSNEIIGCTHGDDTLGFVQALDHSSLDRLEVRVRLYDRTPSLEV